MDGTGLDPSIGKCFLFSVKVQSGSEVYLMFNGFQGSSASRKKIFTEYSINVVSKSSY